MKKLFLFFFLSYEKIRREMAREGIELWEIHQKVWWSPFATTRILKSGRLEPVYNWDGEGMTI